MKLRQVEHLLWALLNLWGSSFFPSKARTNTLYNVQKLSPQLLLGTMRKGMRTKKPIRERHKRYRFLQSSHSLVLLLLLTVFFFFFLFFCFCFVFVFVCLFVFPVRETSRVWDGVIPDVILGHWQEMTGMGRAMWWFYVVHMKVFIFIYFIYIW